MVPYSVLLVSADDQLTRVAHTALAGMPLELTIAPSFEDARSTLLDAMPRIAIVSDSLPNREWETVCEALRKAHQREPFQIILAVSEIDQDSIERALNGLIDDFHPVSDLPVSLRLRVQAAMRRLNDHMGVSNEREFYRKAARSEEELTSRALDETLALRHQVDVLPENARVHSLTGLLRQAAMLDAVDSEIERAVRSLNTIAGFMIALDDAKKTRESFGNDALSRLYGQVGRALDHGMRKYDIAGHYDEDVLFVVLPGTDLRLGELVAGRFRSSLARLTTQAAAMSSGLSFSFGVSEFSGSESRDQWLARAHAALIRAGSLGGDRVETDARPANAYAVWKASRGG